MKDKKRYIIIFVSMLVISLIAHVPAAWIYKFTPKQADVRFDGINGTIWNGNLQQLTAKGQSLGTVYWSFRPLKLFIGRLEYQVRFGQGSTMKLNGKGLVGVGFSGMYAENALVSLPISEVIKHIPTPIPLDLKGQLELSFSEFQYAEPWCTQANGNLAWTGAQISSPIGQLIPGPVIADLTCTNQVIDIVGNQNSEQVSSNFKVNLGAKAQYKIDAWFKPEAQFPKSMAGQLSWLGKPTKEGHYPFNFTGKL